MADLMNSVKIWQIRQKYPKNEKKMNVICAVCTNEDVIWTGRGRRILGQIGRGVRKGGLSDGLGWVSEKAAPRVDWAGCQKKRLLVWLVFTGFKLQISWYGLSSQTAANVPFV